MKELITIVFITFTTVSLFGQPAVDSVPKGKPIIQVFGNFDYNATKDVEKKYSFWFGRAHFGYEYSFNKQFSGRIVLDIGRPTTVGEIEVTDTSGYNFEVTNSSKEGSYYTMTLKFASLEWKPNKHIRLQAGGILQNHYITQEKFWGYRYLAETFQDRYYKIPSSDLGAIGYFTINKKIAFDLAVTNGEGFRFDQDQHGKVKLAGGIDLNLVKGLQMRLYSHQKMNGDSIYDATEHLYSFFAGYRFEDKYRLGFEYNYILSYNGLKDLNSEGLSAFTSLNVYKGIELFARYDFLNHDFSGEDVTINGYGNGNALITGIHYNPVKGVNVSLNYQGWFEANTATRNHLLISFEYKL